MIEDSVVHSDPVDPYGTLIIGFLDPNPYYLSKSQRNARKSLIIYNI
jgi:hypothetical protein